MSSEAASAFDDPRLGTLSPWLWVPWTLLVIYLLLWFSFKRDHFIHTYYRLIDYLQTNLLPKVPCIPKRYSQLSHRIRLNAQDVEASLLPDESDDEAEGATATVRTFDGDDDELPSTASRTKRIGTWHFAGVPLPPVRAATNSVLETLGWTKGAGMPNLSRALWGTREQDRTGRIRLGEVSSSNAASEEGRVASGAIGWSAMVSRVKDIAASKAGAGHESIPSAPGAGEGSRVLFGLGEEDAVELPHDVELPSGEEQELPEWRPTRA